MLATAAAVATSAAAAGFGARRSVVAPLQAARCRCRQPHDRLAGWSQLAELVARPRGSGVAVAAASGAAEGEDGDSTNVELFRQSLIQGWGSGALGADDTSFDWAQVLRLESLAAGDVLLAWPSGLGGLAAADVMESAGSDLARALPVVLLTQVHQDGRAEGVWLTRRTGKLMGDYVNCFCSRPLHYGGPVQAPLTMVHPYPEVPGARPLGESGLFFGGDFDGAQQWVEDGEGSSLRFRFFLNQARWEEGELAADLWPEEDCSWIAVRCSKDLILAEADALDEKPLWARIAELAGGAAEDIGNEYGLLG